MAPKLSIENVRKSFRRPGRGEVEAIHNLNFSVEEGEYIAIVGQTGAGKSVLFDLILGLKTPTSGAIRIGGEPLADYMAVRPGRITRIFQEDRLLPWRRAWENVAFGLEIAGVATEKRRDTAFHWLTAVGLAGFEECFPAELSGGMRQRVNIARAFATEPEIILMDEAFSSLDEITAGRLRDDFLALAHQQRMTYLIVTHNIEEALILGQRVLVFGAPAKVVHEVVVPPGLRDDRDRHDAIRHDIRQWIGRAGRVAPAAV